MIQTAFHVSCYSRLYSSHCSKTQNYWFGLYLSWKNMKNNRAYYGSKQNWYDPTKVFRHLNCILVCQEDLIACWPHSLQDIWKIKKCDCPNKPRCHAQQTSQEVSAFFKIVFDLIGFTYVFVCDFNISKMYQDATNEQCFENVMRNQLFWTHQIWKT